ncbi:MAG: IS481 family transposase [Chthoniobacterales bacterium]|nr:IS481 family transposase [Chthoniobacterales bacterium]
MNVHHNARLTARGRERIVRAVLADQLTAQAAALQVGLSERSMRKWIARFRAEGTAGLRDRSSRPQRHPRQTPAAQVAVVLALRRLRLPGFQIARQSGLSRATVSRLLRRHGLARLSALEPAPPVVRYQRQHPGELLHFDIKKLGRIVRPSHRVTHDRRDQVRGAGWEYVHVCIDDASRLAFAQIMPDEGQHSAVLFLERALAYFASLGIKVQRIMSDNGSCYRSHLFRAATQRHRLRHLFTRPYTPRTNGKAERFIQTSLREWAYAAVYAHSAHRADHLQPWLHRYNWHRPHSALQFQPPISKLHLTMNNLLSLHI